jgi:hypothetical protein
MICSIVSFLAFVSDKSGLASKVSIRTLGLNSFDWKKKRMGSNRISIMKRVMDTSTNAFQWNIGKSHIANDIVAVAET